jgi:hypothetical protein
MFSRILGMPLLLGAAVAVPYISTNGPEGVKKWWNSVATTQPDSPAPNSDMPTNARFETDSRGPGYEIYPISTPLEGEPSLELEEIFRFDVTKEWVYERWARKSTALSELGLYGVRIPLVSGTQIYDLAGSLTYFFNQYGKVERISFQGNTGDTTRIVTLARQHGLQPQATAVVGEQLLQIRQGEAVFSELRTRPSSVLWSSSPHDSFAVEFELQQPAATTPLPPRLPPVADFKPQPTSTATTENDSENVEDAEGQKGFRESMKTFFPRSRVPAGQVDSLEKRDRIW